MLYLVATPIGNLEDFSLRAKKTLEKCDYILAEDTRTSQVLLAAYNLKKHLKSFHRHNEKRESSKILEDLESGLDIAIISDAGTPLFCDPGLDLVKACIEKEIPFTAIPGACSILVALQLAGFEADHFQFIGFLSKKPGERKKALKRLLFYPHPTVCFESPHRILSTLKIINNIYPDRSLALVREMTKKFEEVLRGNAQAILNRLKDKTPKGEIALVIAGAEKFSKPDISIDETIEILQNTFGISTKEALKTAAKILKTPKKKIYRQIKGF